LSSIAGRVSRWLAKDYQSTRGRCSKDKGFRFFILLSFFRRYASTVSLRKRSGLKARLGANGHP